jgi:hypothetical protein
MYSLDYDRIAVLDYLKKSIERMRKAAKDDPDQRGERLRTVAEEIAADTAKLEADLIAAGHLPKAANER